MNIRALSVLIGIYQAIAVFVFLWLEMFVLDSFVDDWTMTGSLMIAIAVLLLTVCIFLVTAYPIHLVIQRKKSDAAIVFISSVVSIGMVMSLLYLMVSQWAVID